MKGIRNQIFTPVGARLVCFGTHLQRSNTEDRGESKARRNAEQRLLSLNRDVLFISEDMARVRPPTRKVLEAHLKRLRVAIVEKENALVVINASIRK